MLTITTASAGSGKTHTLAQEYLRLALNPANPLAFTGILAITFTRKATAEIKTRIIDMLAEMAAGTRALPIQSPRHTPELATKVYKLILEQYDSFQVVTLDSFFQQIIRSFAYELNLPGNYELTIDTTDLKARALERLMGAQGTAPEVLPLLRRMVVEQLEEGGRWDVRRRLSDFASKLFTSSFTGLQPTLTAQYGLLSDDVLDALQARRQELNTGLEAICDTAAQLVFTLISLGIKVAGKNSGGLHKRLLDKKERWHMLQDSAQFMKVIWADVNEQGSYFNAASAKGKSADPMPTADQVAAILQAFAAIKAYLVANAEQYNTLNLLAKQLKETLLLTALAHVVDTIRTEENVFLLHQQARFLKEIAQESSVPFIYQRTGVRLQHFLLDEMQDTSQDQWQALLPLVKNGVDAEKESLVVGDVKQAIYRWREGDASLMLGGIASALAGRVTAAAPLDKNYRSLGQVITFNNEVVAQWPTLVANTLITAADALPQERKTWLASRTQVFTKAYANGQQQLPLDKADTQHLGMVQVSFLPKPKGKAKGKENENENEKGKENENEIEKGKEKENDETTSDDAQHRLLTQWLAEIKDLGYAPGQVCILVRKKKDEAGIAKILQQELARGNMFCAYASAGATYLTEALPVRLLLALMGAITCPEDRLAIAQARAQLALFYHSLGQGTQATLAQVLAYAPSNLAAEQASFLDSLPAAARELWPGLAYTTPGQVAQALATACKLTEPEDTRAHVLAFIDVAQAYEKKVGFSLVDFIAHVADNPEACKLNVPPAADRIQILTIHKAKGLEFDVVLVPRATWKLDESHNNESLWLRLPNPEAYFGVHLASLNYSGLDKTALWPDALNERVDRHLDAINLAYVAFTRAARMLYIATDIPTATFLKSQSTASSITDLLWLHTRGAQAQLVDAAQGQPETYRWGAPIGPKQEKKASDARNWPLVALPAPAPQPASIVAMGTHSTAAVEAGLLAHFFTTAHVDGRANDRSVARFALATGATEEQVATARRQFYGHAGTPLCARLWATEPEAWVRTQVPLALVGGTWAHIPRWLHTGSGAVLAAAATDPEAALALRQQLVLAAQALTQLHTPVAGVYLIRTDAFSILPVTWQ